jgi:beta-glucosidase
MNSPVPSYCPFPAGFLWGAATAAAQIEGAANLDGRGDSTWDAFCRRPGVIAEGATPAVACDHYHRYRDDVALMRDLGLQAYRFSSSWSRVIPDGDGAINERGLDFYDRLVDELLRAGIQPWLTLFHWDLPQALEEKYGGWENRACADAFARYAAIMARRLGDRLAGVFTFNEFMCFLDKGYGFDAELFAPGKHTSRAVLNQARHHALLAHGFAVQAIRQHSPRPLRVGLAENVSTCIPVTDAPEHVDAARTAFHESTGMFLVPIMEGAYHPAYLAAEGADAPRFTAEEMRTIAQPLDFLGLNLYAGRFIRSAPEAAHGWAEVACDAAYPRMHMPWLTLAPQVLYWIPRFAHELWKTPAIYVTENGCANPDAPDAAGEIWDIGRVMFLQTYLAQLHRAVSSGVPVRGYFLWSLLDNFEWAFGYTKRFGLCYTDYATQRRTPKLSAKFYRDVIARNALG